MDISFHCNKCGQHILIDYAGAGVSVECPACKQQLLVPRSSQPDRRTQPSAHAVGKSFQSPPPPVPPPKATVTDDSNKCPFCAETIKRDAKVCRFCGLDLATGKPSGGASIAANLPQVPAAPRSSGAAKAFLILFCIGAALFCGWYWINHLTPSSTPGRSKDEYRKRLVDLKDFMVVSAAVCEGVCNKHSRRWCSAAESRYGDINVAIYESLAAEKETIEQVKKARDTIETSMRLLNDPPTGYERGHARLVELFGIYNQLVSQTVSPSGSLQSYNQDVNKLTSEFTKTASELNVLTP